MSGDADPTMSPEEQKRLWEYTLHEDGLFNERQGLFLVAQSMLAVAYTTALVAKDGGIARTIAIVGLVVSAMWVYVSVRHTLIVSVIQTKAKQVFPEYRAITAARAFKWMPIPSRYLVAFGMPPAILALWVVLVIERS